jgi:lipoate-protein ligase A
MIFIDRPETNPHFNIAAEEYILRNFEEDVVMLWQCDLSVIVGKHQNAYAEVNLPFADQEKIPVIRRISGGGTVFHDPGNINYTVITSGKRKDRMIDFRKFTLPIIDFLSQYDAEASFEGKNNLIISGRKFSGNSAHVYKNRVLHHGTLLFNSDLDLLDKIIQPSRRTFTDKAVRSVRASVTNLKDHFPAEIMLDEFKVKLKNYLFNIHNIKEIRHLLDTDIKAINRLVEEKYKTWQWNLGYSPAFEMKSDHMGQSVVVNVRNGFIERVDFSGKSAFNLELSRLSGTPFRQKDVREKLIAQGMESEDISYCLNLLSLSIQKTSP